MCGINGIFVLDPASRPLEADLILGMNRRIAHRGPDDTGVWSDPARGIWLGHQRLSILDLSARGHQPMLGSSGSALVYNGEIYNYRELRRALSGPPPGSDTDTEVLLRLYEEHGARCLDDLNGMFAFGIWNPAREQLFLARDRLGIKPLYYTEVGGVFAFSSEVKALLSLPWVRARLDEAALYHFLTFNRVPAPQTMFAGIHKLTPGHTLTVGRRGIEKLAPYWECTFGPVATRSEAELATEVRQSLRRSVAYQMVSDVPVGAFLSGGVDSSAVVAMMSELVTEPVRTFSIGFEGAPLYDERDHALAVSRRFRTEHHEKVVTADEITGFLPRVVDSFDEPLADATAIPIWFLSKLARDTGTKVILTGDGSDELFCGYRHWARYAQLEPWFRLVQRLPAGLRRSLATASARLDDSSALHEIMGRASRSQEFFWVGAGGLKESAKRTVLSDEYAARMQGVDLGAWIAEVRNLYRAKAVPERREDFVDWMTFGGLKDIVPNMYLYRADRLGMANSVEIRVPFLDHHFVTLGTQIPSRLKLVGHEPKYLLKKALETVLPREVLYRSKQGFVVPLQEWIQRTIVGFVERHQASFCARYGLFSPAGIQHLVDQVRAGRPGAVHALWNIYFLMLWCEKWLP
jgi:asparagine synthase (glutamine-hydrolysing)